MRKKIAVFGGTFDPIHLGHMNLAKTAVEEIALDKLYIMPNALSPFKQGVQVSSAKDRCNMINLSIINEPKLELLKYEIDNEGISYTYDTLTELAKSFDSEIYFVLGYDSLVSIDTWYCGEEILKKFPLISGVRPGTDDALGKFKIAEYQEKYDAKVTILHIKPFDCSSSRIRELAIEGKSLAGLVTKDVESYIIKNGLYRD